MPESVITVAARGPDLQVTIEVPLPELLLALPAPLAERLRAAPVAAGRAEVGLVGDWAALSAYFTQHLSLRTADGITLPLRTTRLAQHAETDAHVGRYQALALTVDIPAASGAGMAGLSLSYDAIIHQVPNHAALVRVVGRDGKTSDLSEIRYDFAKKRVVPVQVRLLP